MLSKLLLLTGGLWVLYTIRACLARLIVRIRSSAWSTVGLPADLMGNVVSPSSITLAPKRVALSCREASSFQPHSASEMNTETLQARLELTSATNCSCDISKKITPGCLQTPKKRPHASYSSLYDVQNVCGSWKVGTLSASRRTGYKAQGQRRGKRGQRRRTTMSNNGGRVSGPTLI